MVTAAHESSAYGTGRERLLAAARETFAEKGYRGATTRDTPDRSAFARVLLRMGIAFSLHADWLGIGVTAGAAAGAHTGAAGGLGVERMLDEAARLAVYGVDAERSGS